MPFQFFDRNADYRVTERRLPHWEQTGVVCYITWRVGDSLPRQVIETWQKMRDDWLIRQHLAPGKDWQNRIRHLPRPLQHQFRKLLCEHWERHLDDCHGACVLRRPEVAQIVADSLHHFQGERYDLTDFVVMPNHVHILVAFPDEAALLKQCRSWKHFTATQINRLLGQQGEFWQTDGFDHLVRGPDQYCYFQDYIADNPRRAGLSKGEFIHFSRR